VARRDINNISMSEDQDEEHDNKQLIKMLNEKPSIEVIDKKDL
jgi:hypothetical protein